MDRYRAMVEKLSENLDLLMTKNRLTASKVASQTGIPASTIKKIRCRVITNPTLATLIPLANFFSVSLEEMIFGEVLKSSEMLNHHKVRINKLPIINWVDAIKWPNVSSSNYPLIISENNFTSNAFALQIYTENWHLFPLNSLLLFEPTVEPKNSDFVLVHRSEYAEPTLKQFLNEDESVWLRSINISDNIVQFTNLDCVLGVLIEHRKIFKPLKNECEI